MKSERIDFEKVGTVRDFIRDCHKNIERYCRMREGNLYKPNYKDRSQEIILNLIKYFERYEPTSYGTWFHWVRMQYNRSFQSRQTQKRNSLRLDHDEEIDYETYITVAHNAYSEAFDFPGEGKMERFKELYPELYGLVQDIVIDGVPIKVAMEKTHASVTPQARTRTWRTKLLPKIREIYSRL